MTAYPLFQNTFISKEPRVTSFVGIIKIETMVIKTIFKDSRKKFERIRNDVLKYNLYLYFLMMSAELKECVT